ncbi:retrovirus-related Pol polyprotein from transposon 297 [Trichonephila clavipes]|nr:retrovirus-related Pol polyprotein from transposon 297 [Trichonephila clavipes]
MLATELGLALSDNLKIIELKDLITNSDRYDEEFVKDVLSVIVEERTATEKQKAAELEEKQKAVVVAQQREREFELEKMKIQLQMQKLSQAPITSQQLENPKLELNRIIPRFNSKEDEMGLYLTIFERQVKFLNIPEKTWTAYLIGSLPPDIAQLIAREDEEDAQNYEKIKRKTPENIKEHFLDICADLNDPLELVEKLDAYDSLRHGMKNNPNQTFKKKKEFRKPFPLKKNQPVGGSHEYHSFGPSRTVPRFPSYKTEGRNSIQCYGCGTPGVIKSKCPKCTRANEMETAVNCMTLFNLNSNSYPTSAIVLKIFGEKITVSADACASHTIAGEKMFKFLQEHDVTFTNKRISFMMADGIQQTIMALSTVVDLYIESKVIPTEFLVLPDAKGNKTLLGLDFLNAAGIVLDVQGVKWHFSGNPRKQYKFFKKTLEDITLSAFELRKDEDEDIKPGDKVWVTIHPISRNNRSRKFIPKREGSNLILTLRSPVTYEIAGPTNPDQAIGTYHVSALKDYQEPERNTVFVAPLRKRGRPKRNYLLVPSRDVNGTRGGVCNTRFNSKTKM